MRIDKRNNKGETMCRYLTTNDLIQEQLKCLYNKADVLLQFKYLLQEEDLSLDLEGEESTSEITGKTNHYENIILLSLTCRFYLLETACQS